jgi:hypothetical protein
VALVEGLAGLPVQHLVGHALLISSWRSPLRSTRPTGR